MGGISSLAGQLGTMPEVNILAAKKLATERLEDRWGRDTSICIS
jgi:hypothetical protein